MENELNSIEQMTLKKTPGPNGPVITMVSWKAGSVEVRPGSLGILSSFFRPLGRKGAFLKTMKIENGTPKQLFIKVRHWDPLKTGPRSGFEKTWKINENAFGKSMFFDGPKPLKSIDKQTLFLILGHSHKWWKAIPKGTSKVMFLFQNWDMGLQGLTCSLIFDVLVRC